MVSEKEIELMSRVSLGRLVEEEEGEVAAEISKVEDGGAVLQARNLDK